MKKKGWRVREWEWDTKDLGRLAARATRARYASVATSRRSVDFSKPTSLTTQLTCFAFVPPTSALQGYSDHTNFQVGKVGADAFDPTKIAGGSIECKPIAGGAQARVPTLDPYARFRSA